MCTNYKGWTNYQTWSAYTWITSDETTYDQMVVAADAIKRNLPQEQWSHHMAQAIEGHITDENPIADPSLHSDLMQHAIEQIDLAELAEAFLED